MHRAIVAISFIFSFLILVAQLRTISAFLLYADQVGFRLQVFLRKLRYVFVLRHTHLNYGSRIALIEV